MPRRRGRPKKPIRVYGTPSVSGRAGIYATPAPSVKYQTENQLMTRQDVKKQIARILGKEQDVYYNDALILTASITQNYYDVSNALSTSKGIAGISMTHKYLQYKGVVNAADSINHIRFIIFKWKPDTANYTPQANDVIRNDGSTVAPWGLRHYEKRKQVTVLFDHLYTVQTQAAGAVHPPSINFDIKLYEKDLGDCQFNQGLTTGTNHLYFLYVSDSGAVSHPTIYGNLCVRYLADDS